MFGNNNVNISLGNSEPINGSCTDGWTLLEPGVIVDDQIVTSKGYCIKYGFLYTGIAVSIGPLVDEFNNLKFGGRCAFTVFAEGMFINIGSIVTILDENTTLSDVYVVQEDPIITNLTSFSTITLNETVCLDSGLIIGGLVQLAQTVNKTLNGSCPTSTVQLNEGVGNNPDNFVFHSRLLDSNTCLQTGLMTVGRVLISSMSAIVGINQTLSSGRVCSIAGNDPANATGVVLSPGVVIINSSPPTTTKPLTTIYYPSDTSKYYENNNGGYYNNKPYEQAEYRPQENYRYQETYQNNNYQEDNYYSTEREPIEPVAPVYIPRDSYQEDNYYSKERNPKDKQPEAPAYRPRDDDRYPKTYQYNRYQADNYYQTQTDRKRNRNMGKSRKFGGGLFT